MNSARGKRQREEEASEKTSPRRSARLNKTLELVSSHHVDLHAKPLDAMNSIYYHVVESLKKHLVMATELEVKVSHEGHGTDGPAHRFHLRLKWRNDEQIGADANELWICFSLNCINHYESIISTTAQSSKELRGADAA